MTLTTAARREFVGLLAFWGVIISPCEFRGRKGPHEAAIIEETRSLQWYSLM